MHLRSIFFLLLLTAVSGGAFAQQSFQSIGLRTGAPMGVTYKRYFANDRAIEFLLGSVPSGWHSTYYRNSFNHYSEYDDFDYQSHRVRSSVYLQARYLFRYHIEEDIEGSLEWYWGVGALFKGANVNYRYRQPSDPFIFTDTRNDVDFGLEGPLGAEYTFEHVPITLFAEASLFFELADRPATFRGPFIGLGGRYNF